MPPKIGVHPREDAFIHAMPAYLSEADAVGLKWVAGYPGNQQLGLPYLHGLFVLSDAATGRPLAVMDATWITELRTAAASMLGIRALAEGDVESVGILGCGRQAQVHLELAGQVFPALRRAALFDRHPERAEALAAAHPELDAQRGGGARGGRRRSARADHLHARSCATPPGRSGASTSPTRPWPARSTSTPCSPRTCSRTRLSSSSTTWPSTTTTGSRATSPATPTTPLELCDAIDPEAGHPPGLRVFVPLGIALEDVAVAAEINRRASEAGVGRELPL